MLQSWFQRNSLLGFIDGARDLFNGPTGKEGIRGFLIDIRSSIHFIFSGPSPTNSPLSIEEHAFLFLLEAIFQKGLKNKEMLITSDSLQLVRTYSTNKSIMELSHHISRRLVSLPLISLLHINKKFNTEADMLAKEGKSKAKVVAVELIWVIKLSLGRVY